MPPEIMPEELSAAIASVLPAEIGTFRTGSGVMDYEGELDMSAFLIAN